MACMEHVCVNCNWSSFDNTRHGPGLCPDCGGDLRHHFDEPLYDDERDDREPEPEEDDPWEE